MANIFSGTLIVICFIIPTIFGPELHTSTTNMQPKCHHHDDIILLLRARGDLGTELKNYFDAIQASDLRQKIFDKLPPHCKLTRFFRKLKADKEYIAQLKAALVELKKIRGKVTISGLTRSGHHSQMASIGLQSDFLSDLSTRFIQRLGLSPKFLQDPKLFSILLSTTTFKQKMQRKRIRVLQNIIDLKAKAKWSLFLYKRRGDTFHIIKEIRL
jgi:hypothetical protein